MLAAPSGPSPVANEVAALIAFQRPLASRHALAPATWILVLDRVASHPALADHPFARVAPQLVAALPRLAYLRALAAHFDAQPTPSPSVEAALALHALIAAEPGSDLALRIAAALAPESAPPAATTSDVKHALVDRLRVDLEQTAADEAEAAFAWLDRLREVAPALIGADPLADSAFRAAAAPEGVPPAALFRLRLVGHHQLRSHAQTEHWQTRAKTLAADAPATLPGASAAARSLPTLIRDLTVWPAELETDLADRSVAFVARLLAEEHRFRRPAAARASAFRRIALTFVRDTGAPLRQLPGAVAALAARPAWQTNEPAAALASLRLALPGLVAAVHLLENHLALGAATARLAYASLPAYAARTGSAGEAACAKDNAHTLRQLGLHLLDGLPQPAERLQAWWSAVVGVHLVNRPPGLFVHNLRCLHATLRAALPADELDAVFAPLHQLYKEGVGVPDSLLLHLGVYPAQTPAPLAPETFAAPDWRKRHLKRVRALAAAPETLLAAWPAWLDAPHTTTLAVLAAEHGSDPVLRVLALLLGDVTREFGLAHPATRLVVALPERLACHLLAAHLERIAATQSEPHPDLAATHAYFAEQLRLLPLERAVLQATRHLVEAVRIDPDTNASWIKTLDETVASPDTCPALARSLLDRWLAHLRVIGPRLAELHGFVAFAYPAGHPVLARSLGEEKKLRGALTASLLPYLLPAGAPWGGDTLRALAPAPTAAEGAALVAFLDRHFDQLDGAHYYDLLALVGAPPAPTAAPVETLPAPASPRAAALVAAPVKKGLLGGLFGPPPEHLAHDLALAAVLAPDWLAPLLPAVAPEPQRLLAVEQARAWSLLPAAA